MFLVSKNFFMDQQVAFGFGEGYFMIPVMGCQGSEVQILSCRPKFPKKTNPLRLVFLFLRFDDGKKMAK